MKFGKVDEPSNIDFSLPNDAPETAVILGKYGSGRGLEIYIGCAKWNKNDLKGFYPKGVKDELSYYANAFNSIELNATFYKMPDLAQVEKWKSKVPTGFKFCPKITNTVSHFKRLLNAEKDIEQFCNAIAGFDENLGITFLQLHDNFHPKDFDRLREFLRKFPQGIPLAVEVRNTEWMSNAAVFSQYTDLLTSLNMANIIVDTAGRRDLLHMHLTNDSAFVRYVGANTSTDYNRLDEWVDRVASWSKLGLRKLYFFIHQNVEVESPLLAAHFINGLNRKMKLHLKTPNKDTAQKTLF